MRGLKGRGCWRGVIEFGIVIFTLPIFNKDMGNASSTYTAALWLLICPCFIEVIYLSLGEKMLSATGSRAATAYSADSEAFESAPISRSMRAN
jgi:hypothetical protein